MTDDRAQQPAPVQPPAASATPVAQGAPATQGAPSDDLPDWLKAITQDSATNSVLPDTAVRVPASAAPEATPPAPAPDDLPDWLKAITQGQAAEPPVATREPPVATREPPVATTPVRAAPKPPVSEPPVTAPLAESSEDLPDWLKAITQASSAAATAAASTEATPSASTAPAAFDAETTLVPPVSPVTNDELPSTTSPAPADEPTSPGFTLPPWLVGVGTAPVPDVQELPDLDDETLAWLSESKKAETAPEPAGLDLTNAKLPAEKPEWLDALAAVTAAPGASPAATPETDIAPTPTEDMPDWLRSMRGQAGVDEASSDSTPDWLRALRGQAPGTPAGGTAQPPVAPHSQPPVAPRSQLPARRQHQLPPAHLRPAARQR